MGDSIPAYVSVALLALGMVWWLVRHPPKPVARRRGHPNPHQCCDYHSNCKTGDHW